MANVAQYTVGTLPNNLPALRTGTANDGRMLVATGPDAARQQSVLRDLRSRLPSGWVAEMYRPTGVDAVITHVEVALCERQVRLDSETAIARRGGGYLYASTYALKSQIRDLETEKHALLQELPL